MPYTVGAIRMHCAPLPVATEAQAPLSLPPLSPTLLGRGQRWRRSLWWGGGGDGVRPPGYLDFPESLSLGQNLYINAINKQAPYLCSAIPLPRLSVSLGSSLTLLKRPSDWAAGDPGPIWRNIGQK